jgi:xanthine dehydrogenase YagS FAD-binding subunit
VTEILLPAPAEGLRSSYLKVRERKGWDLALVSVALALQMKGGKVAGGHVVLGGVAPVPWHSKEAENAIMGKALDAGTIAQAAEAAVKGAEPLKFNGYKVAMVRGAVEEALQAIAA